MCGARPRVGANGCGAVGIGMLYFLDPQRDRSRRTWMADKPASAVRQTGRTMHRTGRHIANRVRGVTHDAGKLAHEYMGGAAENPADQGKVNNSIAGMYREPARQF